MIAYIHPQSSYAHSPLTYVQAGPVAPNAGAAGSSDVAKSAAPSTAKSGVASDNGGQLAGSAVPGGVNHAPVTGSTPQSFSAPAKKE